MWHLSWWGWVTLQYNIVQFHPFLWKFHNPIFLYSWTKCCHVSIPCFHDPFIRWWFSFQAMVKRTAMNTEEPIFLQEDIQSFGDISRSGSRITGYLHFLGLEQPPHWLLYWLYKLTLPPTIDKHLPSPKPTPTFVISFSQPQPFRLGWNRISK